MSASVTNKLSHQTLYTCLGDVSFSTVVLWTFSKIALMIIPLPPQVLGFKGLWL